MKSTRTGPFPVERSLAVAMIAVVGLTSSACSVFGVRSTQELNYKVTDRQGDKEIRAYPSHLVARTWVAGDYEASSDGAFRLLFEYISGNNVPEQLIAMTAPVVQVREGEKISMTAPVNQEREGDGWTMEFVMPTAYTRESVPSPADPRIEIVEVPARTVAVVRYSGLTSEERLDRLSDDLAEWLDQRGYRAAGPPRSARYDPPFTVPFLRRSEVQIDVAERREPAAGSVEGTGA